MDVKFLIDKLAENARPLGTAIFFIGIFAFLLRTGVARRLRETIEETVFSNWRLALLGTTGIVLSAAAGLFVAILALLFFNYLQVRVGAISAAYARSCERFVQALLFLEAASVPAESGGRMASGEYAPAR